MERIAAPKLRHAARILRGARSVHHACVVDGTADGVIFGDRGADSEFLLVWSAYQEGFQLMGEPLRGEALRAFPQFFEAVILPFLQDRDVPYFEYGVDAPALAEMLASVFRDREILSDPQRIVRLAERTACPPVPQGYRIARVDDAFLRCGYGGMEAIRSELASAFGADDRVPEGAVLYVALHEDGIVARADALFTHGGCGSVSVDTDERHRNRGLSTCLASRVVDELCAAGIAPVWDCTEGNGARPEPRKSAASSRSARTRCIGFRSRCKAAPRRSCCVATGEVAARGASRLDRAAELCYTEAGIPGRSAGRKEGLDLRQNGCRRAGRKSGFTLVEIIVVLVILAVLAAIAIPSMTGWIDQANEKSAIAEARTCLTAMQGIAVERYAAGATYDLAADEAETLALAEAPAGADIQEAAVNAAATVTRMVYLAANGVVVTYENGMFTTSAGSGTFADAAQMKTVMDAFKTAKTTTDSGALSASGSESSKVIAALRAQGIDLAAWGATSWAYRGAGNGYGPFFYWTPEDISQKAVGDKVVVMRYNSNEANGRQPTYMLWEATIGSVTSNGITYNAMTQFQNITVETQPEQQTYAKMMENYKKAVAAQP